MARKKTIENKPSGQSDIQRRRISQANLPKHSLREALTVAQAITDNFAGDPTLPHQVAMALNLSPTSSIWRSLAGATTAYGLTKGSYNSTKISLTELGRRCTAPTEEGDDIVARGEAALTPKVIQQFFEKYNRSKFPTDQIAKNVLQQNFNVPPERVDDALRILMDDGTFVGIIHQMKTGAFVSTEELNPAPVTLDVDDVDEKTESTVEENRLVETLESEDPPPKAPPSPIDTSFRVFITHGKNRKIVGQVKDVLDLYDIEYEIAVEEESPAIPVSQKVLTAMRKCQAGVMIVSGDDDSSIEPGAINNNVLIEIGTAFVLYDQRVVLLWDKGLKVPSNLQGLYRCEFEGSELSFAVGTKLAKAVKGFRK